MLACHLLVSWHLSIAPIPPLDPAVNFRKFPKKWRQRQVHCRKLQHSPWLLPKLKRRVHRVYRSWAEKLGINSAARNDPQKAGTFLENLAFRKENVKDPWHVESSFEKSWKWGIIWNVNSSRMSNWKDFLEVHSKYACNRMQHVFFSWRGFI